MAKKVMVLVNQIAERPAPYLDRLRQAGFEVVHSGLDRLATEDELLDLLPGVYATIAGGEPYTDKVFDAAKDLKMVARFGVGYDKVDVAAATRHGVAVAMAFGSNHESVADGAFMLLSATACDLPAQHALVRSGGWSSAFHPGIWQKTIGIIGLGRIGRALARRCSRGFDMRVLAYDPVADAAYAKANNIELTDLETLLRSLRLCQHPHPTYPRHRGVHQCRAPGDDEALGLSHQHGAGHLVDEDALYDALKNRRIAGAGLDVYRKEPPVGSPLLTLENVVLLPHSSGMDDTGEAATANTLHRFDPRLCPGRASRRRICPQPVGPAGVLHSSSERKCLVSVRSLALKERLKAGETTYGGWLTVASPVIAEIMAGTGFDWVVIDTEHGGFDNEGLMTDLIAFNGSPTVPIVRVPWNDAVRIKQILDMGADGILVPMVNSRGRGARPRSPPASTRREGSRGFGPRRASDYGRKIDEYVAQANDGVDRHTADRACRRGRRDRRDPRHARHRRGLPRPDRPLRLGRRAPPVRASDRRRRRSPRC